MAYTLSNDITGTSFDDRTDKNHAREWLDIRGTNEGRPMGYNLWLFKEPPPSPDGTFQVRAGAWTYKDSFAAAGKRVVGPKLGNGKLIRHDWNPFPGEKLTFAAHNFNGIWRGGAFLGAKFEGGSLGIWYDGLWCGTQFEGIWHDGVAVIADASKTVFRPQYQGGDTVLVFSHGINLDKGLYTQYIVPALKGNRRLVVVEAEKQQMRVAIGGRWLGPVKPIPDSSYAYDLHNLHRECQTAIKQPYDKRGNLFPSTVWNYYLKSVEDLKVMAPETKNEQLARFIELFGSNMGE